MNVRPFAHTGVQVSPLCLGAMMFGSWGNPDRDEGVRIIHRALDAGINFIDTADVYSAGESEEIVGKALKGRRDDVVLATKLYMPVGEVRRSAFEMRFEMRVGERLAADGHGWLVGFDYAAQRAAPLPDAFREVLLDASVAA